VNAWRSDVVGIFLLEQNGEWAVQRGYMKREKTSILWDVVRQSCSIVRAALWRTVAGFARPAKLGIRLGVHILPAHYYAPAPNIIELERTVDLWAKPSAMSGVHIDLDEQIDNLRRVCAPFQQEFRGNPYYKHAVNQPFRSGRSRFFGYIEAEVLHAVIRHYKPARLIEIGGGVPSYCTSQAISMNRRDTGVNGHITCIEYRTRSGRYDIKDLDEKLENFELIARPIQDAPLTQLQANDVVFIDSNHVVRSGSEVN
jgi:hypothetical protein